MPTVKTVTFGCKVNQYETEHVRQALAGNGYSEAASDEPPDLCIVNTCTVTTEAEAQCRKRIRVLSRRYPGARFLVLGCYAARAPREITSLSEMIEVVPDKRQLPAVLATLGSTVLPQGIAQFQGRRRALVKVQDGCPMHCAYCIVPTVRPLLASRPVAEVLEEIARLVEHGHREVVLTGIHLGCYGVDQSASPSTGRRPDLVELVTRVSNMPGDFRLRLSSIEAAEIATELVALLREHPERICPHLHLPLQSGSDAVLARMRRRDRAADFVARCREIRLQVPGIALTTDVIVGFPGESEADFQQTCRVVEEVAFAKVHAFRFSPRPGTAAASMPDQVQDGVRQRRAAELAAIARRLRRDYLSRLVGSRLQVLLESPLPEQSGRMLGTAAQYVPVEVSGPQLRAGAMRWAEAQSVRGGRIVAVAPAANVAKPNPLVS